RGEERRGRRRGEGEEEGEEREKERRGEKREKEYERERRGQERRGRGIGEEREKERERRGRRMGEGRRGEDGHRAQKHTQKYTIYTAGWLRSALEIGRSSDIQEELRVEPLLLHIERSQLGWLRHLARMPSGCLPLEVFRTCPTGRRPRGRPRTRWRDYISRLAWERLGVPSEELMDVAREGAVWASLLKLLPL
ncbi:hypothetical protein D4764_14G0003860, partial [Takifugu flavidus]